jgi:hypothetical protein
MEVRYLGFEQPQNAGSYQFDVVEKGEPSRRFIVTADLSLFHTHGVAIQEGPSLCAGNLWLTWNETSPGPTSSAPRIYARS